MSQNYVLAVCVIQVTTPPVYGLSVQTLFHCSRRVLIGFLLGVAFYWLNAQALSSLLH